MAETPYRRFTDPNWRAAVDELMELVYHAADEVKEDGYSVEDRYRSQAFRAILNYLDIVVDHTRYWNRYIYVDRFVEMTDEEIAQVRNATFVPQRILRRAHTDAIEYRKRRNAHEIHQ